MCIAPYPHDAGKRNEVMSRYQADVRNYSLGVPKVKIGSMLPRLAGSGARGPYAFLELATLLLPLVAEIPHSMPLATELKIGHVGLAWGADSESTIHI